MKKLGVVHGCSHVGRSHEYKQPRVEEREGDREISCTEKSSPYIQKVLMVFVSLGPILQDQPHLLGTQKTHLVSTPFLSYFKLCYVNI